MGETNSTTSGNRGLHVRYPTAVAFALEEALHGHLEDPALGEKDRCERAGGRIGKGRTVQTVPQSGGILLNATVAKVERWVLSLTKESLGWNWRSCGWRIALQRPGATVHAMQRTGQASGNSELQVSRPRLAAGHQKGVRTILSCRAGRRGRKNAMQPERLAQFVPARRSKDLR